jgi:serine/threonine protein kinase
VASGEAVDWKRAESTATGPSRPRVRALRDVARIADFHRSLQRETAPDETREIERWGDLLLLERVGSGKSGHVHRAWDPALQREVALKLSQTDVAPEEWLSEARALAQIHHPHVVGIYGAAVRDGRAGLWMEFLEGPSLEDELARRGPLAPAEVRRVGAQLAGALDAVHRAGIVHRDVKPSNVVLTRDGRAVLTDFGLGLKSGVQARSPFSGTPLFMSPERLAGAAARPSDDLYALGATLWCALAGKPPFGVTTLEDLRDVVTRHEPAARVPDPPGAPRALAGVLRKAMSPAAAQRYESAPAFGAALAATAHPRRRWLVPAVTIVIVGLIAASTFLRPRTETARRASPPPAAPAPVATFDVSASFVRESPRGERTLLAGDRVAPGDRLAFSYRSTVPSWVYVLDSDEKGESYLLFPQPLFDRKNPLPADSTIRLPGTRAGRESAWTVTSRGGREHLLVVASPRPLPELEAQLSQLPAPSPDRPVVYARLGPAILDHLRGIGGVADAVHGPAAPAEEPPVFEHIRVLAGQEQGVSGVWVRQVVLENPAR